MSVRLATADDIALLDGMLSRMGQFWSQNAIRELSAEPWITIIHETGGVADGFYCLRCTYEGGLERSILGPGDGPHESHEAWLRAICEMGIAMEAENLARHPAVNDAKSWIVTRIPPTMGPLREFLETRFGWVPIANPGPGSGKEGYSETASGIRTYWVKRRNLVAKAKLVLKTL